MTLSSSPAWVKTCCISSKNCGSSDGATMDTALRNLGNVISGRGSRRSRRPAVPRRTSDVGWAERGVGQVGCFLDALPAVCVPDSPPFPSSRVRSSSQLRAGTRVTVTPGSQRGHVSRYSSRDPAISRRSGRAVLVYPRPAEAPAGILPWRYRLSATSASLADRAGCVTVQPGRGSVFQAEPDRAGACYGQADAPRAKML